jgi:hypothetical protein
MHKRVVATLFAAAMLAVAGCNSGSAPSGTFGPPAPPPPPPPPPPPETSTVRILHASADAPNVDILVEGNVTFANVPFLAATPLVELDSADYEIQVNAIIPGDERLPVIGPVTLSLEGDTQYNVLALGDVGAEADAPTAFGPLILEQPQVDVGAGNVRLRVVHAAPGAPEVEVFATAPGDLPPGEPPLGTFAFGEDLGPVEVPAGDYQIRVGLAGGGAIVFDSGAVALPETADLLIAAVTNTGAGDAPIQLLVSDGQSAFTLLDATTPANVRVVHASPDAPNVDVLVDGNVFLADVPYTAASGFESVPPGDYVVQLTPAGDASTLIDFAELSLEGGTESTAIAAGLLNAAADSPVAFGPLLLGDDRRRIATEAKVRIVHGAPSAGLVDVYVVEPGAGLGRAQPALVDFDFRDDTGYLSLTAGSYDVYVTLADSDTVAIGPVTIDIENAGIYTAIARDPVAPSVEDPNPGFGLILLDDFVAP